MAMVYGISPSTDPRFNLAMEQYLFEEERERGLGSFVAERQRHHCRAQPNTETELDGIIPGPGASGWYGALPEAGRFTMTWEI